MLNRTMQFLSSWNDRSRASFIVLLAFLRHSLRAPLSKQQLREFKVTLKLKYTDYNIHEFISKSEEHSFNKYLLGIYMSRTIDGFGN